MSHHLSGPRAMAESAADITDLLAFPSPEQPGRLVLALNTFQVNRDLEIRDLYNMDDAFRLSTAYGNAYRARPNANLAFWDGLDGKADWPVGPDGAHPLTELILADYLVVDVAKPYAEKGSFLERSSSPPAAAKVTGPAAAGRPTTT